MRLTWRRSALAQLDAICNYIAQDSPAAAAALQARIEKVTGHLAEYPYMGRATQGRPNVRSKLVVGYLYRIFIQSFPSGRGKDTSHLGRASASAQECLAAPAHANYLIG